MKTVIRLSSMILLTIIGFYLILTLLIFTVSDSDKVILYAFAIVIITFLILVLNQLVGITERLDQLKKPDQRI
ncbi:hypothetical protein ACRC6Q_09430 [Planococcus sp. SE5232]|uniref:hypothetical protein n=1 Tax=unclassified Planococcus (in: firmicutes) TaxID=2662419 RepID=UPI003D6BC546